MSITRTDTVSGSDQVVLYKTTDVDFRSASMSALVAYLQSALTFPGQYVRQDSAPSASPFTLAITSGNQDIFLRLTPTGTMAVGTLTLPLASGCLDGQRVMVFTTQAVTTLNLTLNGATAVLGAPTTLAQYGYFTLVFDIVTLNWNRVG